jgi:hypothetical protein
LNLKMPVPKFPANASIMEQFKILTDATFKYIMGPPARITGQVNMIRPDGTQPAPQGFTGPAESLPWGINVDGNDNVWVGNNWNSLEAAASPDPSRPTSTWGGGSGFTVIYGVAAPVKPPRIGKVRGY